MRKTVFRIAKMDCPSEEQMIRMKLEAIDSVKSLHFDIPGRTLEINHQDNYDGLLAALDCLDLDTKLLSSEEADLQFVQEDHHKERHVLLQVLAVNFGFFALEIITGLIAGSMGLVADSLDMLADSIVYGLSLGAVGTAISRKKKVAGIAGYFQLGLAIVGFAEVIRRFLGHGEAPDFLLMIVISCLALGGNTVCLYLLQKAKSREAHMQASMIFTSNDVIVNAGVIVAGILVYLSASNLPDLITGTIIFLLVGRGAYRILRLSR
ncbi:MAG TPA: cation transporter [Syntrophorhabdaceae bacterium]|jgi:Co/Zn/Cd efflux system component